MLYLQKIEGFVTKSTDVPKNPQKGHIRITKTKRILFNLFQKLHLPEHLWPAPPCRLEVCCPLLALSSHSLRHPENRQKDDEYQQTQK